MKIVSITTIKNEADIIESFVRYHSNIMDLMIILNNGSTDNSAFILQQLINEGLSIVVINDEDKYFEPLEKYNFLLNKAINEFNADIVCPLDCDEFISSDDCNPRQLLEKIPKDAVYLAKWRTYVPTQTDDFTIKFIPKRIKYIRDENIESDYKVIIPKEIFNNYDTQLIMGNHDISDNNQIERIKINTLKISHFPLRSVNQTMSKILVNYPNTISRKEVKQGISYHYKIMFDKIKKTGTLTMDDVTEFATQYSLEINMGKTEFENQIPLEFKPMHLDFCTHTEIKYSYDENPMENLLNNYIYFAEEINKFKVKNIKDTTQISSLSQKNQKNQTKIKQLEQQVCNIKQEYILQNNKLVSNKYCHENSMKIYKKENTYLKNKYLKHSRFSLLRDYLYIILSSKGNEIFLNLKLFKALRNSNCFNLGYYLNKYPEIIDDKICKKYSPELHYVCHGFDEGKIFNPKCCDFISKKTLLKALKEK